MLSGYEEEYAERCRVRRSRSTSGQGAERVIPLLVIVGIVGFVLWSATRAGAEDLKGIRTDTISDATRARSKGDGKGKPSRLLWSISPMLDVTGTLTFADGGTRVCYRGVTLAVDEMLMLGPLLRDLATLRAQVAENVATIDRLVMMQRVLTWERRYERIRSETTKAVVGSIPYVPSHRYVSPTEKEVRAAGKKRVRALGPCPPWPWKTKAKTKEGKGK